MSTRARCRSVAWASLGLVFVIACGGLAADGTSEPLPVPDEPGPVEVPPELTCADNPLLEECDPALLPPDGRPDEIPDDRPDETSDDRPDETSDDRPDETSDDRPDETSDDRPDEYDAMLRARTRAVDQLLGRCGACHIGTGALGGDMPLGSWDRLVREGYVVPCSARRSRLVQVAHPSNLPPPYDVEPVGSEMASILTAAIELNCTEQEK